MVDTPFDSLLALTTTLSGAFLLVMVLREPCRKLAGSKFTYWIWLLVPVALVAILLPAVPHPSSTAPSASILMVARPPLSEAIPHPPSGDFVHSLPGILRDIAPYLLAVWSLGLVIFLGCMTLLQRRFMARLGRLSRDPSTPNVFYSHRPGISPSVVGLLPSRIVLPADFSILFDPDEQRLILAHECTHVRERHPVAGAAGLLILAIQWFNPLAYLALRLFRADQELACDAAVVAAHPGARATYAKAMLKVCAGPQFVPPLAYSWSGALSLPVHHRISLLSDRPPPPGRRATAAALLTLVAAISALATYVMAPHAEIGFNFGPAVAPAVTNRISQSAPAPRAEAIAGVPNKAKAPVPSAMTAAEPPSVTVIPPLGNPLSSTPAAGEPTVTDFDEAHLRLYNALAEAAARGENVAAPKIRWATTRDGQTFAGLVMGPSNRDPQNFDDYFRITAAFGL
ncbi:MAG: hypothetical protein JWM33_3838 [Caulobacteraceae bacterium]|nr:hypothetical protein [Caulobacteraceae bacterium]